MGLWRQRWRWLGAAPLALGIVAIVFASPPDLLVTGDGKHLAVRTPEGRLALLRPRAGEYVRDVLAELSGVEPDFLELETVRNAACSDALCIYETGGARRYRILATRSRDWVRWDEMIAACAEADIIVSDRPLPDACRPRWLKADRTLLRDTGGLAFELDGSPNVTSVSDQVGRHHWAY
jgi:competence protein ComEC